MKCLACGALCHDDLCPTCVEDIRMGSNDALEVARVLVARIKELQKDNEVPAERFTPFGMTEQEYNALLDCQL